MDDVLTRSAIALPLGIAPIPKDIVGPSERRFAGLLVVIARRFCLLAGAASRQGCAPIIHGAQPDKSPHLSRYSNLPKLRYSALPDYRAASRSKSAILFL